MAVKRIFGVVFALIVSIFALPFFFGSIWGGKNESIDS